MIPVFQVKKYIEKIFKERGSPNELSIFMEHGGKPWVSDFNHPHYVAGRKAMQKGKQIYITGK